MGLLIQLMKLGKLWLPVRKPLFAAAGAGQLAGGAGICNGAVGSGIATGGVVWAWAEAARRTRASKLAYRVMVNHPFHASSGPSWPRCPRYQSGTLLIFYRRGGKWRLEEE